MRLLTGVNNWALRILKEVDILQESNKWVSEIVCLLDWVLLALALVIALKFIGIDRNSKEAVCRICLEKFPLNLLNMGEKEELTHE